MMLHKWICDMWFNKFFIVPDCCPKFFFVHAIPALKQGSCSMVVTENLSCGPHYSIERQLCLSLGKTETRGFFFKTWCDWPQQSVCHGCWCNRFKEGPSRSTERRSVVVDGSSIQGCVTLHRGGVTLHRGDIYLHRVVVRTGYPQPVLGRIDLHWNVWILVKAPLPSPETGHLVGWEMLGVLVWK